MVFVGVFIRLHFSEQPAPGLSMEPRNKLARSSTRLALPARSQKDALQQEPQLCKRILASRHDRHRKDCFAKKKKIHRVVSASGPQRGKAGNIANTQHFALQLYGASVTNESTMCAAPSSPRTDAASPSLGSQHSRLAIMLRFSPGKSIAQVMPADYLEQITWRRHGSR